MENVENGRNASPDFSVLCNYALAAAVSIPLGILGPFLFISHAKMQPEPKHIERTISVRKRAQNKHTMEKSALRRIRRKWREKEEKRKKNRTFIVAHFAWSVVFFVLFDIITTNDGEQHDDVMRHCRRLESSMKPGSVWKSIKLLNLKDIGVSSPLSSWHCTIHFNSFHTHESLSLHALKGWQKLCDFLTLKDAINNPFSQFMLTFFWGGLMGRLRRSSRHLSSLCVPNEEDEDCFWWKIISKCWHISPSSSRTHLCVHAAVDLSHSLGGKGQRDCVCQQWFRLGEIEILWNVWISCEACDACRLLSVGIWWSVIIIRRRSHIVRIDMILMICCDEWPGLMVCQRDDEKLYKLFVTLNESTICLLRSLWGEDENEILIGNRKLLVTKWNCIQHIQREQWGGKNILYWIGCSRSYPGDFSYCSHDAGDEMKIDNIETRLECEWLAIIPQKNCRLTSRAVFATDYIDFIRMSEHRA